MNYVISNITDEIITKGQTYPIISMHDDMVHIDVDGKSICFDVNSGDVTVCLNCKKTMDFGTLVDWYISSVSPDDTPVWTEEHIEELLNNFYVIPKDQ